MFGALCSFQGKARGEAPNGEATITRVVRAHQAMILHPPRPCVEGLVGHIPRLHAGKQDPQSTQTLN